MLSVRLHQLFVDQTWLTTRIMKKNFISNYLTPILKKGTEITLEILNMRRTKTVQN